MSEQLAPSKDETVLAGLAHGSILLGLFTSGVGGIVAALVIWVTQKEKSPYVAAQALQAMVYQAVTFVIMMIGWCCWLALYMALIFVPLISDPVAFEAAPPAGLWWGLALMIVPLGIWGLIILYGLFGAVRCFLGHEFRYVIIGRWLEGRG